MHIDKAISEIDKTGIPKPRESYRYDLLVRGKRYPPKLVISIAKKYATGSELSHELFNAIEAKNYFIRNKIYSIVKKSKNPLYGKHIAIIGENEESTFAEGKAKYRVHRSLERDSRLGKKAKLLRLQKKGVLECDVCNFSFSKTYGVLGEWYIEAHHTTPVSKLSGKTKTKISELALVCSNCHRIIHRANLSIEELRKVVQENSIN